MMSTDVVEVVNLRRNAIALLSDGRTATEAARECDVSRQTVYEHARRAESSGKIVRVRDARPRRWRAGPAAAKTSSPENDGARTRTVTAWIGPPSKFGDWPPG